MKTAVVLVLFALGFVATYTANSDAASSPTKRPLDLPSGGPGPRGGDDDAPEVVLFFGSEFEGEAFFWCFAETRTTGG